MSVKSSMMDFLGTYRYHALAALFFGCMLLRRLKRGKTSNPRGLPLPPGPKGHPLIGNLFDHPVEKPWLVYKDWCKTYGDIVYFNVLGQHFLVLGSLRKTTDLFEKRSSNYSDRIRMPMMMDLMKWDYATPFLAYDAMWRKQRKIFHEFFQLNAVSKYLPIQRRVAHNFLRRLFVTPDDFLHHIQHLSAATIMSISYGIDVQESGDPFISLAEDALEGISQAAVLGTFWVDLFPSLKYIPSWFPGAGFQKKAAHWREVNASLSKNPFHYAEDQLNGKAAPSMAATLIDRLPHKDDPQRPMEERLAQDVAVVSYLATADTTNSIVQALFLAMALYPEVQKKAQAEIDSVVGPNHLPNFEDRPSLPYINAVVKESMRWHVPAPLAMPHMATNDDEYDGYYIPKGTVVLGNAWSILHDPELFNNPMEYQPERYLKDGLLNPDYMDTNSVVFGFGRRICPGRHLADNLLYSIVSCLLAVYDIKPPVDDKGNPFKLEADFTSDFLSHPVPFKCIIKPRTPAAEALIRDC